MRRHFAFASSITLVMLLFLCIVGLGRDQPKFSTKARRPTQSPMSCWRNNPFFWFTYVRFGQHVPSVNFSLTHGCGSKVIHPSREQVVLTVSWVEQARLLILWMDEILHHPRNPRMIRLPCKYQQPMVSHGFQVVQDFVHPQYGYEFY